MTKQLTITERRIAKYGLETCKRAWELNIIDGEGPTVISINTGLHFNSVGPAIEAYADYIRAEAANDRLA